MIGHAGKGFAELIGKGLSFPAVGAHLVCLIHNDQIPAASEKTVLCILDTRDP